MSSTHARHRPTPSPHMHLYVIYPVLLGFVALFLRLGIGGFRKRVLS